MNFVVSEISPSRKRVVVNIPAESVRLAESGVLADFVRQARLPGFRPGKAPAQMVRAKHAKAIQEELVTKVLKDAYAHISKEGGLNIFHVVKAEPGTIDTHQDAEVSFEVDITPEIVLPEYKGIPVNAPSVEVSDQELDAALEERRRALAKFEVIEGSANVGDYVKLSYEGSLEGKPLSELVPNQPLFSHQKNTWEEAGAGDAPGVQSIINGIVGLKAGDETTFKETFAEDFREPALAGKTADYKVEVHEVRTRILPEPNDPDFLKQHGVDSLEALKESLSKHLKSAKEGQSRDAQANQIMAHLCSTAKFELPESAIEAKMPEVIERFLASDAARRTSKEVLERDKDKILADLRDLATRRLQEEFLLDKVIELEKLQLVEEDIQKGVWQEAMLQRIQIPDYVKQLEKDKNAARAFYRRRLHHKALEFLVKEANVTGAV